MMKNKEKQNTLVVQNSVLSDRKKYFIILVRYYLFLKNYVTSEGAISHNVLYYRQLSIAPYQVSFYAKNWIVLSNYQ